MLVLLIHFTHRCILCRPLGQGYVFGGSFNYFRRHIELLLLGVSICFLVPYIHEVGMNVMSLIYISHSCFFYCVINDVNLAAV